MSFPLNLDQEANSKRVSGQLTITPTMKMGEHTPQRAKSGTRDVARCNLSPAMLLTGSLILGLIGEIRVLTET